MERNAHTKHQKEGGLDKAALAKRRMKLREEAENTQKAISRPSVDHTCEFALPGDSLLPQHSQLSFQISENRPLELYYENFWRPFPFVMPCRAFQRRVLDNLNHGMRPLIAVLHWIGSVYAPWTPSIPYHEAALRALQPLPNTPFNVQALMLFALAQHNSDFRPEARRTLDMAVEMALQLRMNEACFAQDFSEGDPVLAESWRRTYYFLHYLDQEFAVVAKSLSFILAHVPIEVDLPCEDDEYESGQIPEPPTLQQFNDREFEEIETVYSSIAYLHGLSAVLTSIMKMVLETGAFSEQLTVLIDAKVASWHALLPASKKDPLRMDGAVDEVMWQAHLSAAILLTVHRPFSALVYSPEEFFTRSFMVLSPMVAPSMSRRAAHTARALKGLEIYTKLVAIPTALEKHGVFSFSIAAQMATAQISACKNLLDDHALMIGRDRLRLTIGYLSTMGQHWPLARAMAKEVKAIARSSLSNVQDTIQMNRVARSRSHETSSSGLRMVLHKSTSMLELRFRSTGTW